MTTETRIHLTAALIVRNESSEIVACLDSLAQDEALDAIVVVDTGSLDDTRELVAAWSRRHREIELIQREYEWIDDFSRARNYAAAIAESITSHDPERIAWIVHVDADMRATPGSIAALRSAMMEAEGETMAVWQESNVGGWRNRRVLAHRPGLIWLGAIHEAMERDDGEIADEATFLYGWSESHLHDLGRNLRILRREAEERPTARVYYYLGSELVDQNRHAEAITWFYRCISETQWRSERADAWLHLAKIYWSQSRGDEARNACLNSLANLPDCREALELMATMSWPDQAAVWRRFASTARNEGVIFVR